MEKAIGFTAHEKTKEFKEVRRAEDRLNVMLENKRELKDKLEYMVPKESTEVNEIYNEVFKSIQKAIEKECEIISKAK